MVMKNTQAVSAMLLDLVGKASDYLEGNADTQSVDKVATQVVVSKAFDALPDSVRHAVHVIFDTHDGKDKEWHPKADEIRTACVIIRGYVGSCRQNSP